MKKSDGTQAPKMGRRNFLKSSGKILPALAVMGLAMTAPLTARADCNSSCEGSCYSGCTGSCMQGCTGSCQEGCTGNCQEGCAGSCMEGCTGGSK